MNNFALTLWYDEGSICTFYSVKKEIDGMVVETDVFFDKFTLISTHFQDEALQLFRLITESIGNKYGAIDAFFDRIEHAAQALPPKPKKDVEEIMLLKNHFPLRLFCYRISEQIVVLFNGDAKEGRTIQESKLLYMKFLEAQHFATKIQNALQSGLVEITSDKRYLQNFDGTNEIIL